MLDREIGIFVLASTHFNCSQLSSAKNSRDRDDLYLSSSSDESEEEVDANEYRNLIEASDDEGDDSDDAQAFQSDDENDIGAYARALAKNRPEGNKRSLLTDLDPTEEEVKKKRKIDSWCNSSELKVSHGLILSL